MTNHWCEGDQIGLFYLEGGRPITARQLRSLALAFPRPMTAETETDCASFWGSASGMTDLRQRFEAAAPTRVEGRRIPDLDVHATTGRQVLLATGILMERYDVSSERALEMLTRAATSDRCSLDSAAAYLVDTGWLGFQD